MKRRSIIRSCQAPYVLRALYTTATYRKPLGEREGAMLEAARETIGVGQDVDIHAPITGEAFAAEVEDKQIRLQAITAMVIMSVLDEDPNPQDADFIEAFAQPLGVSSSELKNLRQIVDGDLFHFQLDVARRVWLLDHVKLKWKKGGMKWLVRTVGAKLGVKENTAVADRYRALAAYPEGTVGRLYYDHMREVGFPLPGEKGSQEESVIIHDLTHLLSGYDTSPEGEVMTASFSAGNRDKEPFTYIFFVICQHHLGNLKAPFAYTTTGLFDAAASVKALKRGSEVNTDLSIGWDPWTIMHMPLDEARASLNVPD